MPKVLLAALFLLLAGCAQQFMRSAQRECEAFGYAKDSPEYAECVERQYQANQANYQERLGRASAIMNSGTPPAASYAPPRSRGRFLQRDYVDGFNRICVYSTIQGQEVVTIGATELCPIN